MVGGIRLERCAAHARNPRAASSESTPIATLPITARAAHPDAELSAWCREFFAADRTVKAWDTDPAITQAEGEAALYRWDEVVDRITARPARTPDGIRVKLAVAHAAMLSLTDFDLSREEQVAISALADVFGRA